MPLIVIIERRLKIDQYKNSYPNKNYSLPQFWDITGFIYVMFLFMTIGIFFNNVPFSYFH